MGNCIVRVVAAGMEGKLDGGVKISVDTMLLLGALDNTGREGGFIDDRVCGEYLDVLWCGMRIC